MTFFTAWTSMWNFLALMAGVLAPMAIVFVVGAVVVLTGERVWRALH